MSRVSVLIPTFNEEANLPDCLDSIRGIADQVVVIDSFSTDRTPDIARAAGARALAIDYRLAPEHPFPAAVEDATKAYRWLLKEGLPSPHEYRHHARTLYIAAGVPYAESALLLGQKLPGASGGYVHAQHLVEQLRPHAQALEDLVFAHQPMGITRLPDCTLVDPLGFVVVEYPPEVMVSRG